MNDDERVSLAALSRRLRLARIARLQTQQQIADRAGLSRSAVNHLETGGTAPRLLTVWRLADALGVPIGDLLTGPER